MKKIILFSSLALILIAGSAFYIQKTGGFPLKKALENNLLQEGDIIFQSTYSEQCAAVKMVTKSEWSHCGLIFNRSNEEGDWWVLEAVQPVKWTRLQNFIARGQGGHYVIKRLKNMDGTKQGDLLQKEAERYLGKNYDALFQWSNENIYCSELVWKTYMNTLNQSVGQTQFLRDFDLSHPQVAKIVQERYGDKIPWDEKVISPQAIYEHSNLDLILKN